ncbi:lipopolysaccharide biosynthesis protein [Mesorhizobium sp. M0938]|uniref:lipopolysaccharide biosynthesis protein n=1 Tax=unclassified Mesorhizobium TaxID=325217 RepID=UPI00333BD7DA
MNVFGRQVVSGAVWAAVETWGRQIAMFGVFVVLARHLGPEAFGLAALAMVVPNILAAPVTRGLPDAIIQREEIDPIHLDSAFCLLAATGAAITALIWISAGAIAAAFDQPHLEALIKWTSAIVVIQAFGVVPAAILKRQLNFRLFAVRTLTGSVVGGALGVGMAIAGFGVWSLVWMQLTKAVVETAIILFGSSWRPNFRFSYVRIRELFGFAGPLVLQTLWNFANDELPKIVLGAFLGPHAVGIYALARRPLDLLVESLLWPLMAITLPTVSRIQAQPEKINSFFNATVRVAGIIGFPAFFGFAAVAPIAVPFIFGQQWSVGVAAVQILMVLGVQRTVDSLCSFTILALGRSGLLLKLNMVYTVLALALITGGVQISFEWAIAALVASNVLLLPVFLIQVQRLAHIDVLRPLVIFPRLAVASILMFAVVSAWLRGAPANAAPGIVLAGGILIGAGVYAAASFVLVRPDLLNARNFVLRLRAR